jgi:hypothetical protein
MDNKRPSETKSSRDHMSARNPALWLAASLFGLWVLCWIVLMGPLRAVQVAGLPLITWSQILLGVLAIVVSIVAIPFLNRWERG